MSKCREEFIAYQGFTPERLPSEWIDWICAWNAALEHAAKVCDNLKSDDYCVDVRQAAEAICKEKTE